MNIIIDTNINHDIESDPYCDNDLKNDNKSNSNSDKNDNKSNSNSNNTSIVRDFSMHTLNRKLYDIQKKKHTNTHVKKDAEILNINISKLIFNNLNEIHIRVIGHTRSSTLFIFYDKLISYPVLILSSSIISTILLSLSNYNFAFIIRYISLALAILAFLFNITRDFLKYSYKAQSHSTSAKLYTHLLRTIEMRLIKSNADEHKNIFQDLIEQISIIETYEIDIPYSIDNNVRNNYVLLNI